jgi:transcriptional regulator with XRE-family HTH domain
MSAKLPDPEDVRVGSRIKLLRQEAQMSQRAFAEQLGVTLHQVHKYEKGINRVGAGRLTKIARTLGVSVMELLGEEGQNKTPDAASALDGEEAA